LTRLIDLGLNKLTAIILDMASIAQDTVIKSIESYKEDDFETTKEIFESSAKLRFLQEDVSELAIELIARFQPVATDLRYIKSSMEISYGFSRFGRYAYDIIAALEIFGPLKSCDKSSVIHMSENVLEMMNTSVSALRVLDNSMSNKIYEMEDCRYHVQKKFARISQNHKSGQCLFRQQVQYFVCFNIQIFGTHFRPCMLYRRFSELYCDWHNKPKKIIVLAQDNPLFFIDMPLLFEVRTKSAI
jgi:phosphate transport system protein